MSEMINNHEYRKKILKEIITEIHNGKSIDEVIPRFEELNQSVSVNEISELEQALVDEGMPVEEIQNLCDVHAAVFKSALEDIHHPHNMEDAPGHPIHTLKLENRALEKLINERIHVHVENFKLFDNEENAQTLREDVELLWEIDKHYSKKENLLFPYMEKRGIYAPPKVMWGVDDEIRGVIKEARRLLSSGSVSREAILAKVTEATNEVNAMIFKEENILFPMILEFITDDQWVQIAAASSEIGFTLIDPVGTWQPVLSPVDEDVIKRGEEPANDEYIKFDAGFLTAEEANAMLNTLPIDITFVDKDGAVKYFTQGKERIFARPKTIIGRQVQNCHPPASVHIVEQIVADLRSGIKDHEDFWIKMGDKYVYIRYYAVRNEKGEYLGTMEVTQDIQPIQELSGEKRLVSN